MNAVRELESPAAPPRIKSGYLSVVLKVSERCNLACPYCYFFFGGDDTYKKHPPFIGERTVDAAIEFITRLKHDGGVRQVRVGFHGGEPLLVKKQRFREMCAAFRAGLGDDPDLALVLQTNGVLIDREWVDVFGEFDVRIGVSIDGTEAMHDSTRVTRKGLGTYAQTRQGWQYLIEAAAQGRIREPSILCVVSPGHSGGEVFRHFAGELQARSMNFLLPDVTYDTPGLSSEFFRGCGDFLIDVCREWFASERRDVSVRFLNEALGPLISDELMHHAQAKHDPLGQVCISSSGSVCPDDVIRAYAAHFSETGEHVEHSSLESIERAASWMELRRAYERLPEGCADCTWRALCRGGELQHRYSRARAFDNPSIHCDSLKRVYAYVVSRLLASGYSAADVSRRLGAPLEKENA